MFNAFLFFPTPNTQSFTNACSSHLRWSLQLFRQCSPSKQERFISVTSYLYSCMSAWWHDRFHQCPLFPAPFHPPRSSSDTQASSSCCPGQRLHIMVNFMCQHSRRLSSAVESNVSLDVAGKVFLKMWLTSKSGGLESSSLSSLDEWDSSHQVKLREVSLRKCNSQDLNTESLPAWVFSFLFPSPNIYIFSASSL